MKFIPKLPETGTYHSNGHLEGRQDWGENLQTLAARPGRWANLRTYPTRGSASVVANLLRAGTEGPLRVPQRAGSFEFVQRDRTIFGRYQRADRA